jgi:hypothetical protein
VLIDGKDELVRSRFVGVNEYFAEEFYVLYFI